MPSLKSQCRFTAIPRWVRTSLSAFSLSAHLNLYTIPRWVRTRFRWVRTESLMCMVSHVILNISAYLFNVCWDTRYGTRCQLAQNYFQMQKFSSTLLPHISLVIIQCAPDRSGPGWAQNLDSYAERGSVSVKMSFQLCVLISSLILHLFCTPRL